MQANEDSFYEAANNCLQIGYRAGHGIARVLNVRLSSRVVRLLVGHTTRNSWT